MIIEINDNFAEHGLTLEEAYILARVRYYEDEELQYYESNETIARIIGKSISTVRRAVDNLVNKGYLNKKVLGRRRILSIDSAHNEQLLDAHIEHHEEESKEVNRMSDEEFKQFLKLEIQKNKSRYNDSDEEFY